MKRGDKFKKSHLKSASHELYHGGNRKTGGEREWSGEGVKDE